MKDITSIPSIPLSFRVEIVPPIHHHLMTRTTCTFRGPAINRLSDVTERFLRFSTVRLWCFFKDVLAAIKINTVVKFKTRVDHNLHPSTYEKKERKVSSSIDSQPASQRCSDRKMAPGSRDELLLRIDTSLLSPLFHHLRPYTFLSTVGHGKWMFTTHSTAVATLWSSSLRSQQLPSDNTVRKVLCSLFLLVVDRGEV